MKYGLSDAVMARHRPGQIDYRLARQTVLHAFKAGSVSRLQICDAQSELTRNATYCGVDIDDPCPVCEATALRNVTYVFGPRLPSGGRCITNLAEMARLARRVGETLERYPDAHAFLLRRHGLYTWGRTLADAERHVEILEFLFEAVGRTQSRNGSARAGR